MAEWADEWGELWGGAISTIETHEEDAGDRWQFLLRDKETLRDLSGIFAARWQRIDNILADIQTLFDIASGSGFALDAIGDAIGISRLGFDDSFYRVLLATQSGIVIPGRRTVEGLLTMVRSLLNDDVRQIIYKEFVIKTFTLEVEGLTSEELEFFPRFLRLTKPATYNAQFIASESDGFVCDDSTATIVVTGEGLADAPNRTTPPAILDVGGELAFIIPI